jgi:murein DD-endopeptidase MepM/ murein hydrolase activator NlpD
MGRYARRRGIAAVAVTWALLVAGAVSAAAQILPPGWLDPEPAPEPTTPTTPPPTTAPPSSPLPPADPDPAPSDPGDGDGGAGSSPSGGRSIPPDAQAAIDAVVRSSPNDNHALVDGAAALAGLGVPQDEAVRAVFGRFPILGPARWVDDWHYPRWTGSTFRFHMGLDMFADYGTPLVAPVDGIARIGSNPLGGLTVRVVEPDGTYWYLAHLSGIAEGLIDGASVTVGQVVGFVGDSGNARGGAPHLHLGLYLPGGGAAPPKPSVDAWVADGAARLVALLGSVTPGQPAAAGGIARRLAPDLSARPSSAAPPRSELLWASAASPNGGAVAVADAAAASLNLGLDWERRAVEQRALDLGWAQAADEARALLGPFVHPTLRQATEALRAR